MTSTSHVLFWCLKHFKKDIPKKIKSIVTHLLIWIWQFIIYKRLKFLFKQQKHCYNKVTHSDGNILLAMIWTQILDSRCHVVNIHWYISEYGFGVVCFLVDFDNHLQSKIEIHGFNANGKWITKSCLSKICESCNHS